ncbi:tail fiber domain-containing protein [Mesorhizobium sp. B2-2-2]|uniref:tail fiber domain-containing protein n=1 Tax=Mesorhizobium sp. B2-2-2 TaxID=2589964 RepID=UPI00112DCBDD|nr:tail fiber domain-containing protein [Mesorhizobium sp. B2-2-2]TPM33736.1 tail fiber domain-containing protein [Mesorhizobium sp. B2-2-2]
MGKGSAPEPPDPQKTATAQTGTNLSTAQANAALGNVNQVTPYGSLTYTQSGSNFIEDANGAQYWRGPDGQIQSGPPPSVQGASTTKKEPIYQTVNGRNGDRQIQVGTRDVTTPGASSTPAGWTQVKGYNVPTYTATQTLSPSQQAIFNQTQQAQQNLAATAADRSAFLQDYLGKPMDYSGVPAAGDPASLKMPSYQQFANGPQLQTQIAGAGNITNSIQNAGNIQTGIGDAGQITRDYGPADGYAGNVQQVQDAMFSRLNPQIDRQRSALETQLQNQGIRVGSSAYEAAMNQFNQGLNDQRTSVVLASGQEQSRLADLDAQRAGFQNAAQQQAYNQQLGNGQFANAAQAQQYSQNANNAQFANAAQAQQYGQNANNAAFGNTAQQQMFANQNQVTGQNNQLQDSTLNAQLARFNAQNQAHTQGLSEAYAARQQPLNEIAGLLSGTQLQQPNFVNTNMPTIPTVDYAGLVNENYNQRLGAYNQQQAATQSLLGGLFGLGSAGIMASDPDMKKNKRKVIDLDDDGTGLWTYNYKSDPKGTPKRLGLMADEVERVVPDAVSRRPDGYRQVDYGKALTGLFAMGAAA